MNLEFSGQNPLLPPRLIDVTPVSLRRLPPPLPHARRRLNTQFEMQVAIKDPRMAEQYRRFQERDQRVRLAANVAENGEEDQDRDGGGDDPDMGTEFGGDDEDEAGSDEGEFEGQVEGGDGDVESKSTSQKKTTKGGASVAAAAVSASSDMAAKTKKKTSGKSSTPTLLPTGAADLTRGGVMESCM